MQTHTVSRRIAITGLCAAVAAPVALQARPAVDPIYAAIQTFKDGYAHHVACLNRADDIEGVIFKKRRELEEKLDADNWAVDQLLAELNKTQPNRVTAK